MTYGCSPKRIYITKIENKVTSKIKTSYYLKLLTPKTMKLLGRTNKDNKDKNWENGLYLEVTEVVNNEYQDNSRV